MFGKNTCSKCGTKVSKSFEFCPRCGFNIKDSDSEDYGMFGRNDAFEDEFQNTPGIRLPAGFNMLFKSLVKELDKQFKELEREGFESRRKILEQQKKNPNIKSRGISINITSGNQSHGMPRINIRSFGDMNMNELNNFGNLRKTQKRETATHTKGRNLSEEKLQKLIQFEKTEPKTNVRRLSDKVIYELKLPGVKSIEDISINQLENSLEIKALAEKIKKAYSKHIPLNYPLRKYNFSKESLVLELDSRE